MSEPFLAEIRIFGFNFPPRNWAHCDGQILPIAQNQSLYSLLGTTYGGDGRTTFALPDLRGRVPMHPASSATLGNRGGEEAYSLTEAEIPEHGHSLNASAASGDAPINAGSFLASFNNGYVDDTVDVSTLVPLRDGSVANAGSGAPLNNMQPSQVIAFAIALQGLFPPRD